MKIGDRVLYVGASRPDWHGIPATIKSYSPANVHVEFDREWSNTYWGSTPTTGRSGNGINPADLQLIIAVDADKPIVANGATVKNVPYEVIGTINFKADGRDLLMVQENGGGNILHVDRATGKVVPKYPKDRCGEALTFSNPPVTSTKDVEINDITVRITRTDGVVTAVEWVR